MFSVSGDNIVYALENQNVVRKGGMNGQELECPWRETIKLEVNQFVEYELRDYWIWDIAITDQHSPIPLHESEQSHKNYISHCWTVGADRIMRLWKLNHLTGSSELLWRSFGLDGNYSKNY